MWAAYISYFVLVLFSLCHASGGFDLNKNKLMSLSEDLVHDAVRKGEAVWPYRKVYGRYVSWAVGERMYIVRAKFAQMTRTFLRCQLRYKQMSVHDLIRSTLVLQKKAQALYYLKDELLEFDAELSHVDNPLNVTRFGKQTCHVAGECDIVLSTQNGYRRSVASKDFGSTDKALQMLDARRDYITKTYQKKQTLPPIDIGAELNRTLNLNVTNLSGSLNRETNMNFINLAPDITN